MRTCWLALLAALLLGASAAVAQPPDTMWTRAYGGAGLDEAYGVVSSSDGGFVAVGRSRSFSPEYNVYAVRVNALGDTLWTRRYGGAGFDQATGVCETGDNGYLILGYTDSYGAGSYDAYVIRITDAGDTLWTRTYGSASVDFAYAIEPTLDGGFAFAGSAVANNQLDMWLVKADADGETQWQRWYGQGSVNEAFSLQVTSDNGFLLAGRSVPPNVTWPDMAVVRTNSAGDTLWTRRYGGSDWEEGTSVTEAMDGGVLIGGWKQSGASNYDFMVVKADADGNQEWSRTIGGVGEERITAVKLATDGRFVVGGYTTSWGAGGADYYLIKLDTNGDTVWTRSCGGAGDDQLRAMDITSDGGYIVAGTSGSYGQGSGDFWMVRFPGLAGVAGFVRDSVTNDPMPNVWVSAAGQPNLTRTDATGYFVLSLPPDAAYDIITYGQCVARDTTYGVPVYLDSLTVRDLAARTPHGTVSHTSVNVAAPNHTTAAETLKVYNTGIGILEYSIVATTVPPSAGWLSVNPESGAVLPHDSAMVAVVVTADTTDDGVYDLCGSLAVHMNSCPDSVLQVTVYATILDADGPAAVLPATFSLSAYPNPFNPASTLSITLPQAGHAQLVVFDLLGREVCRLIDAQLTAGRHDRAFVASDLPSGIYIAQLRTNETVLSQKLMLLK